MQIGTREQRGQNKGTRLQPSFIVFFTLQSGRKLNDVPIGRSGAHRSNLGGRGDRQRNCRLLYSTGSVLASGNGGIFCTHQFQRFEKMAGKIGVLFDQRGQNWIKFFVLFSAGIIHEAICKHTVNKIEEN